MQEDHLNLLKKKKRKNGTKIETSLIEFSLKINFKIFARVTGSRENGQKIERQRSSSLLPSDLSRQKIGASVRNCYAPFYFAFFFSFCSPVCAFYPCECYKGNRRSRFRICNRTGYGLFRGTNRSPTNYRSNEWVLAAASLTRNYRRNGKSFIAFKILLFLSLSLSLFLFFRLRSIVSFLHHRSFDGWFPLSVSFSGISLSGLSTRLIGCVKNVASNVDGRKKNLE